MPDKETLSFIAVIITLLAYGPYVKAIIRNDIRPHVFSWIIWGTTTLLVFFAQVAGSGGVGAIPTGVSGIFAISVAIAAFIRRGDTSIRRIDWIFFLLALTALPFWYFSSDPLWAVVLLTVVDLLGFGPTIRKAWASPHTESALFFALFTLRDLFVMNAMEHKSLTTLLFPAAIAASCFSVAVLILVRRRGSAARAEDGGQR